MGVLDRQFFLGNPVPPMRIEKDQAKKRIQAKLKKCSTEKREFLNQYITELGKIGYSVPKCTSNMGCCYSFRA